MNYKILFENIGRPKPMSANATHKLNVFQHAALSWDRSLPYNASHALHVDLPLDVSRLEQCMHACLDRYGLLGFWVDEKNGRFRFEGGQKPSLEVLSDPTDALTQLRQIFEKELNKPFDRDRVVCPFRFFAFTNGPGFYFGLVYFHVIADASSIVYLLNDIVRDYRSAGTQSLPSGRIYPKVRFGARPLLSGFLNGVKTLASDISDIRRSRRAPFNPAAPKKTALLMEKLAVDGSRLAAKSRMLGVTVNDVFLAALLKSCAGLGVGKNSKRRNRIAVSSIVSMRRDLGLNGGREFGLFLSSFRVSAESPGACALSDLAREVGRQTCRIKRGRLYLRNIFETCLGLKLKQFGSQLQRERFYAKNYPLAAGLTNVDMRALWDDSAGPLPEYWRAVSVSAAVPLVFSVTTAASALQISVSFSSQVYTEAEAREALRIFSKTVLEFSIS